MRGVSCRARACRFGGAKRLHMWLRASRLDSSVVFLSSLRSWAIEVAGCVFVFLLRGSALLGAQGHRPCGLGLAGLLGACAFVAPCLGMHLWFCRSVVHVVLGCWGCWLLDVVPRIWVDNAGRTEISPMRCAVFSHGRIGNTGCADTSSVRSRVAWVAGCVLFFLMLGGGHFRMRTGIVHAVLGYC